MPMAYREMSRTGHATAHVQMKIAPTDLHDFEQVVGNAGETWICFIRITAKEPFDDKFDVRVIHDRNEVGAVRQCTLHSAPMFPHRLKQALNPCMRYICLLCDL